MLKLSKTITQTTFNELKPHLHFLQTNSESFKDVVDIDTLQSHLQHSYIKNHNLLMNIEKIKNAYQDIPDILTLQPIIIALSEQDPTQGLVIDGRKRLLALNQIPQFAEPLLVINLKNTTPLDAYNIQVLLHRTHQKTLDDIANNLSDSIKSI